MIPSQFLTRMQAYFENSEEYLAFLAALEEPAERALRVNTLKTTAAQLLPLLPFSVSPLPFAKHAYLAPSDKVGALPAHHAGMFYMQDPGAISTVAAVTVSPTARVLDLCAAPGGKSTQLAALLNENGVLVSNEYVPARCRILQGNIERTGAKNTVVTNLPSDAVADFYGTYFDLVVVDAPCSGEGMFRKYEVASEEWSEENVALCAARQREILENAARCVAPGGQLLYSTCTFSLEENEQNVAWFLDTHPDFSLIPVAAAVVASTADGMSVNGRELSCCRRFYPHISKGEGQFLALMHRAAEAPNTAPHKSAAVSLTKAESAAALDLLSDTLEAIPDKALVRLRDSIYLCPDLPLPRNGIFAAGVCIGTLKNGRIEPHHQLYSAYGANFKKKLALSADDPRVTKYLLGEEIDAPELAAGKNGYAAVLYRGAPLGGGKHVAGRLKNHYPKGLRLKTV